MKILACNGSPRKGWNTDILLQKALSGAKSVGAETKEIHLYDYNFCGCKSCFACKRKGGISYGKCALRDSLAPLLEECKQADALIFGAPIYFGRISGQMASFMERLLFPLVAYELNHPPMLPNKIPTLFIYTMNVDTGKMHDFGYKTHFATNQNILERALGPSDYLTSCDTFQFTDYSQYVSSVWDSNAKKKHRQEQFPIDCEEAFSSGVKLAKKNDHGELSV